MWELKGDEGSDGKHGDGIEWGKGGGDGGGVDIGLGGGFIGTEDDGNSGGDGEYKSLKYSTISVSFIL